MTSDQKQSACGPADGGASSEAAEARNGLCLLLGDLGDGAAISTAFLAHEMGVSEVTVKRMIARGELPPPVSMGKWNIWTAGWLRGWIEMRLEAAAQEAQLVRKHLA